MTRGSGPGIGPPREGCAASQRPERSLVGTSAAGGVTDAANAASCASERSPPACVWPGAGHVGDEAARRRCNGPAGVGLRGRADRRPQLPPHRGAHPAGRELPCVAARRPRCPHRPGTRVRDTDPHRQSRRPGAPRSRLPRRGAGGLRVPLCHVRLRRVARRGGRGPGGRARALVEHRRPGHRRNGLALCALHHRLLDRGVLGLGGDGTVMVSQLFVGRTMSAQTQVLQLAGAPLLPPQTGTARVAGHHRGWHTAQVFRGPARAVA